jgi:hypothetical protein
MTRGGSIARPFGEAACESELELLTRDGYGSYYFYHTKFNAEALNRNVYLIIGRRGAGKTALSHYFSFQKQLGPALAIDVDEPDVFQKVLADISHGIAWHREIVIPRLVEVWEFVIWSVIFRTLSQDDPRIAAACMFGKDADKVSHFILSTLKAVLTRLLQQEKGGVADELHHLIASSKMEAAKAAVLKLASKRPIIVAFDSLENFPVSDDATMWAVAALIQCASQFNQRYANQGIHLKLFLMAEVYPYLKEEVVLNPLKFIRDELYLHWRPKDLMRLIGWRLHYYLKSSGYNPVNTGSINWDDYREVMLKVWQPYFGEDLLNAKGLPEKTFPYILRHTQLRPRQIIVLCNHVAECAKQEGSFPQFSPQALIRGVKIAEKQLADEVLNAYSSVYPRVGRIVEALNRLPVIFQASELDKRAHYTASEWPPGDYSQFRFRHLVTELGIVGRVRRLDETNGYVEADFEYASDDRLTLTGEDLCVIHPMFYHKLEINVTPRVRVYPFPDRDEFHMLNYRV